MQMGGYGRGGGDDVQTFGLFGCLFRNGFCLNYVAVGLNFRVVAIFPVGIQTWLGGDLGAKTKL